MKLEAAKRVITKDHSGKENGFLIELYKSGKKTKVYLSCVLSGAFKGFHLHRKRVSHYVCIKGQMKIILFTREGEKWVRTEHLMDATNPQRLKIPINVATGIENTGEEEAWLINYPSPAYDPALKDEQVEYSQEELEAGVIK